MASSVVSVIATAIEKQRKGYFGLSMSGMLTTSAPTIIAGSVIEIGGTLYLYSTDTGISTASWNAIATGSNTYVELTASGTALAATYTDNVPVWREDYNGWYHSAGSQVRVIAGVYKAATAEYYNKYYLDNQIHFYSGLGFEKTGISGTFLKTEFISIGVWDMSTSGTISVTHGISDFKKIKSINVIIIRDDQQASYDFASFGVVSTEAINQYVLIGPTAVVLQRDEDGYFDEANFDSTALSRGAVTILHTA